MILAISASLSALAFFLAAAILSLSIRLRCASVCASNLRLSISCCSLDFPLNSIAFSSLSYDSLRALSRFSILAISESYIAAAIVDHSSAAIFTSCARVSNRFACLSYRSWSALSMLSKKVFWSRSHWLIKSSSWSYASLFLLCFSFAAFSIRAYKSASAFSLISRHSRSNWVNSMNCCSKSNPESAVCPVRPPPVVPPPAGVVLFGPIIADLEVMLPIFSAKLFIAISAPIASDSKSLISFFILVTLAAALL